MGVGSIGSRECGESSSPTPEVHAGDQSVIGDIILECQLDMTAGDLCSEKTGDREGRGGVLQGTPCVSAFA